MLVDLGAVPVGHALVLAQDQTPPPDRGPEFGKASPVGLVVILCLLIATVILVRSMTRHLRRVPASFDDPAHAAAPARREADRGADQGADEGAERGDDTIPPASAPDPAGSAKADPPRDP